ncbi:Rieske (2Fe-2S) protein [Pedobacter deserti]|uniref:Rieske (2Fe-2S) protein n=1 Tax=Pedobacter deserti TaxID=2817382 RepID=UPI00210B789C|nr:Rieske (2Fe-2S) protein [Pedobacter sp. SYSU D00382]
MIKWHKLDTELPEGEFVKQIQIDGKKLCLARHQGQLYVVQNQCPHAGGILSGGWCRNGHLICPIHRWEYNLDTGRGAAGQGDYIRIYPIEVRPEGLFVGIEQGFWGKLFG